MIHTLSDQFEKEYDLPTFVSQAGLRNASGQEHAIFDMGTQRPIKINLFVGEQTRLTDVVGQVLGSTRVVLNDAGACFSARDYYPYGENMREFTIGTTNRRY
ncbi:MAG: hypothetical protein HYV28_07900 [Ignavibacteriales bacterium]|nr:hypothetical protein [Ignavibacteriales bacterium]